MGKRRGQTLICMGMALIAAAVLLSAYNIYDGFRAGRVSQESADYLATQILPAVTATPLVNLAEQFAVIDDARIPQQAVAVDVIKPVQEIEIPDYMLNPRMEMPVVKYEGQDYIGMLEIPALQLRIPVISEWNYPRLRIAPCRYTGSVYTNDMVISAHNYDAHFGRLNTLREGDRVVFTDVDGNKFYYNVALKETLMPTDVREMTDSEYDLTMFTCTVGGSYRVTIRCERLKVG